MPRQTNEEKQLIQELKRKEKRKEWKAVGTDANSLAHLYRKQDRYEEAVPYHLLELEAAKKINDISSEGEAMRNLAECYSKLGNFESAEETCINLKNIASGNDGEMQIAYHVLGQIYFDWASDNGIETQMKADLLEKAKEAYLKGSGLCSKERLTDHADRTKRLIRARQCLGSVEYERGNMEQGNKYFSDALSNISNLATKSDPESKKLRFLCNYEFARCRASHAIFDEITTKKAKIAYELANELFSKKEIPKNDLTESVILLAPLYIHQNEFKRAKRILKIAWKKDVNEKITVLLKTANKLVKWHSLANLNKSSLVEKSRLNEKIADELIRHPSSCLELAAKYYEQMEDNLNKMPSATDEAKRGCYRSLATTYQDLQYYAQAIDYYEKLVVLEQAIPVDLAITYKDIAVCKGKQRESATNVNELFDMALSLVPENIKTRLFIFDGWREYFAEQTEVDYSEKIKEINETIQKLECEVGEDEEMSQNSDSQSDDGLSDENLSDSSDSDDEEKSTKQCSVGRLFDGENRLHRASRENDLKQVQQLLRVEKNTLNLQDLVGWAPLHEAANHGNVKVVEYLLKMGAKVDIAAWDVPKKQLLTQGGDTEALDLTPAMDAASNGHLEVVKVLLRYTASVVKKDFNDWTVAEHLLHYIQSNEETDDVEEEKQMLQNLHDEQRKLGFTPRDFLPPVKNRKREKEQRSAKYRKSNDDKFGAVSSYQKAVLNVGSKTARKVSPAVSPSRNDDLFDRDDDDNDWIMDDFSPEPKRRKANDTSKPARSRRISSPSTSRVTHPVRQPPPPDDFIVNDNDYEPIIDITNDAEPIRLRRSGDGLETFAQQLRRKKRQRGLRQYINEPPPQDHIVADEPFVPFVIRETVQPTTSQPPVVSVKVELEFWQQQKRTWKVLIPINDRKMSVDEFKVIGADHYIGKFNQKPQFGLFCGDCEVVNGYVVDYLNVPDNIIQFRAELTGFESETLIERYKTFCQKDNIRMYKNLENCLKLSETKHVLHFENVGLVGKLAIVMFRTLQQPYCSIRELCLRGNRLSTDTFPHFARALANGLQHLASLDLSMTAITETSLEVLVTSLLSSLEGKQLTSIKSLNLSFNPLSGRCALHLSQFLALCSKITELNLEATQLTADFGDDGCIVETITALSLLTKLNLGKNPDLGCRGLRNILQSGTLSAGQLPSYARLTELNVDDCTSKTESPVDLLFQCANIISARGGSCSMLKLSMCNCNIKTNEMEKLESTLNVMHQLEFIALASNNLTTESVIDLFRATKHHGSLRKFDINDNPLDSTIVKALQDRFAENTTSLSYLKIGVMLTKDIGLIEGIYSKSHSVQYDAKRGLKWIEFYFSH